MPEPRYDSIAAWYDAMVSEVKAPIWRHIPELLERLLGEGHGQCLDIGCGTGVYAPHIRALGWNVVGLDLSLEQLRIAGQRGAGDVVRAAAEELPFADASFDAVTSVFVHTDLDDIVRAFAEARRVLRVGGRLVHIGVHPCFGGHFAQLLPDGNLLIHPGYSDRRRHFEGPGLGPGLRSKVGIMQVPLADLLSAVVRKRLKLESIAEFGDDVAPRGLAFTATRDIP